MGSRTRTIAGLVALLLAAWTAAADAATITSCTRAAVAEAVATGGSHTFACDGRIVMTQPLVVATTATLDANGRDVTFAGNRPNFDTRFAGSAQDARVVKVTPTGNLTLRGIDVEDGLIVGTSATNGLNVTATRGPTPGTAAGPARGGCVLVEAGGRLVLRDLAMRRCQAAAAPGPTAGLAAGGATGTPGAQASPWSTPSNQNGASGGSGGPGGHGEQGINALDGAVAEGGAIHSLGALDIDGVTFEDNLVRGGRGGRGGQGGFGGRGGVGGAGASPGSGEHTIGGNGGSAGAPGNAGPGGMGGKGGAGRGGAVYAGGTITIAGSHFARNAAVGGLAGIGGNGNDGGEAVDLARPGAARPFRPEDVDPNCAWPGIREDRYRCGTSPTTAAAPGSDGGLNGDGGEALGGAVFLEGKQPTPTGTTNDANRVEGGSGLAAECFGLNPSSGCAEGGHGGRYFTRECLIRHAAGVPDACASAPAGARGFAGAVGRALDPDVASDQADGLAVSIAYEGDDLPGYRLPLAKPIKATVTVRVLEDAPGTVTGIAFAEGGVLFENEADHVSFTENDPPDEPFALDPGEERTFDVLVTGTSRGATALRTRVSGKDDLDRTAEAADREVVNVGEDLEVDVSMDPVDVDLVESDPVTGKPKPKPVTIAVALENVSGEALTDGQVVLRRKVITKIARNPSAPYPLQVRALVGEGGSETPLSGNGALTVPAGAFAIGQKRTLTFRAEAVDKAQVEVRADTSATAAGPRTVVGTDREEIAIGQPKLLALTADEPKQGMLKAGQRWHFSGDVENLSPTDYVTVLVRSKSRSNIAEGIVSELGDPDPCDCGVAKRLAPGERMPLFGTLVASADGGTQGRIELQVGGRHHTFDSEGRPIDVTLTPAQVAITEGSDVRTVGIDRNDPLPEPFSVTEAAWLMSDSAARAFGKRVTGAWDSTAAAYEFMRSNPGTKLAVGMQQILTYVREEAPEAYTRAKTELVATLLAFDDQLDSGEALAIADEAFAKATYATVDAYHEATWQDVATTTGAILGANAPDLALEAIMPALAACKLLKFGGKTALGRRATALAETRPGRILAKGLKGLKPGDEISSLLARKLWGVDGVIDSQLLNYAKDKKLIIAVRERSPGSIRKLAEGLLPKWEAVKAKNVSELDVRWLGFHPTHLDTAMLKQMPDESTMLARLAGETDEVRTKVMARWEQRKKEWDGKDRLAMEAYERDGVIVKPRAEVGVDARDNGLPMDNVHEDVDYELLRAGQKGDRSGDYLEATTDGLPAYQPRAHHNGRFRAMTGDMDPIAILDENGQILSEARRRDVYIDLAKMGIQHPESLTWKEADLRAKYLWDFDVRNEDASALLVYHPSGTRRAGFFDSGKSRLDEAAGGFMAIEGMDIKFGAGPPVAGSVPLTLPPETDPQRYLTPGGRAGANLSSTPGTRLIRRNANGTFSEWTPEKGWQPYVLPAGQMLTTLPQTAVRTEVKAGETRIDIAEQAALILGPGAQAWFKPGDLVVLDPGGPNEEYVTVQALGSIITAAPLKKDHQPGEMVAVVPRAAVAADAPLPLPLAPPVPSSEPPVTVPKPPAAAKPRLAGVRIAKRFSRRKGTTLTFRLDRAATVRVALQRGSKRSTKSVRGKKGVNRVRFGNGLRPGAYRATLTAGGNRVTVRFRVR